MTALSIATFVLPWEFSPTVFLTCALTALVYLAGQRALVRRGTAPGIWRALAFFLGLGLMYAMLQTHFDYLAQHMFWIHRLQHLVLHHVAPILLVLAAPAAVMREGIPIGLRTQLRGSLSRLPRLKRVLLLVQHPILAAALFVGLIYFWLTPSIHFTAMLDANRYRVMNWSMALDGILFWWLMLTPRAAQGAAAVGYGTRIVILCIAALLQILIGAYVALHKSELFDVYAICGRAWTLDPLLDQQLGGLLTWIPAAMMSGIGVLIVLRLLLRESARSVPAAALRGVAR